MAVIAPAYTYVVQGVSLVVQISRFSNAERPPVFPVCLVVDVSASMHGVSMDAVNRALPELRQAILDDPATGEITRIALVTFASKARIALPLSNLWEAEIPALEAEDSTNFGAGLRAAREAIETGIRGLGKGTRFYRPVVFFLSDGQHNGPDWSSAWSELTDRNDKFGAEVVAFGMGDADREAIGEISTGHAYFAADPDPVGAVREILRSVLGSIRSTSSSFGSPDGGALIIAPSPGLTRLPENVV
ncbi:vWA domain-containing protein [Nocardia seriolae]|uniref:vWA domain-containing protein n=1 Tax=Nocardia seriolae TaxID=37332 RepID=UPI001930F3F9|nr:VWA domain-containing protein [Nocardia seriolae]